ncbi:hypothetical protein CKO42_20140 [Lamprobacter modestohalophilus]|uniref:Uncharacterized protein n=1 Tax=Lamprobacter modestohalophilus TaxID=1064514 RepID=A0A9X1B5R0_9GAMM|nr:hypothetical protein [Lamprobacter modestohalophilus]MBK1620698.1 hypothetical protein [Lamprobacter modestohalophilus]
MAQIRIHADSLARLQGFLAGVDWLNDSAVTLLAIDAAACRALIEDRDGDTDGSAHLGPDGLTWVEHDASSLSPPSP